MVPRGALRSTPAHSLMRPSKAALQRWCIGYEKRICVGVPYFRCWQRTHLCFRVLKKELRGTEFSKIILFKKWNFRQVIKAEFIQKIMIDPASVNTFL